MNALQASSGSRRRLGFELLSSEVSSALPSKHPSGLPSSSPSPFPVPLGPARDPDLAVRTGVAAIQPKGMASSRGRVLAEFPFLGSEGFRP